MKKLTLPSLITLVSLSAFSLAPVDKGEKMPDFTAIDEK